MEQLTYKLEVYEGPLDLLLDLIDKNKIDIMNIPISLICDQYMEYIEQARAMDLELAGEFIVMASELLYIKSKMLLPRTEPDEEDPRANLAEALLIYKQAKDAAELLAPLYSSYSGRTEKEEDEIKASNEVPEGLSPELLKKALGVISIRLREIEEAHSRNLSPLVKGEVVSVSEKISEIAVHLKKKPRTLLYIMRTASSRSALIATFMALLELIKERTVLIFEDDSDSGNISDNVMLKFNEDADGHLPMTEF
ncbi:MAG: segregation/condensation protein A [Clostridia bacterium]|nr:segregation/condensation protein A [Clostridia bacterium]